MDTASVQIAENGVSADTGNYRQIRQPTSASNGIILSLAFCLFLLRGIDGIRLGDLARLLIAAVQ